MKQNTPVHFLAWLGLLGVVPAAAVWRLGGRRPRLPARLQSFAGPVVLALVWVHGAVFNPPNNFAVLRRPDGQFGFFSFWFCPHRAFEYREHGALMAALAAPVVVLVALLLALTRDRWRSETVRPGRAALGYLSWVFAGLVLRHIPDVVVDLAEHDPYTLGSVGRFVDTVGRDLALALGLAAPAILLALWCGRSARSARR